MCSELRAQKDAKPQHTTMHADDNVIAVDCVLKAYQIVESSTPLTPHHVGPTAHVLLEPLRFLHAPRVLVQDGTDVHTGHAVWFDHVRGISAVIQILEAS